MWGTFSKALNSFYCIWEKSSSGFLSFTMKPVQNPLLKPIFQMWCHGKCQCKFWFDLDVILGQLTLFKCYQIQFCNWLSTIQFQPLCKYFAQRNKCNFFCKFSRNLEIHIQYFHLEICTQYSTNKLRKFRRCIGGYTS